MSTMHEIIRRPIVTEKSTAGEARDQWTFEVALGATKPEIRRAVETLFGVDVRAVRTAVVAGKRVRFGRTLGKRSNWKKAIVTLGQGQKIDLWGTADTEAKGGSDEEKG